MMEFNLFGIPYVGADICGFFNDSPRELCLRWSLIGAFYPFSRNHNDVANRDQDPANFDEEFEKAVADILKVRYTILPHFYTLFYFSSTRGSTVVRSLLAEFPKDVNTYTISEQILIGGHILLTPVLEEHATSVTGYFPDARWFDYFTGKEVEARKSSINLEAALEKLPIHIRGGAIIVTQQPEKTTSMQRDNNMGIIYACDDEGVFSNGQLYWDDGEVVDPEDNEYLLLVFRGNGTSLSSRVSSGNYLMRQVFDNIHVLGVNLDYVNYVLVNDVEHKNFSFSQEVKKLKVNGLSINPNTNWRVSWGFVPIPGESTTQPQTTNKPTTEEIEISTSTSQITTNVLETTTQKQVDENDRFNCFPDAITVVSEDDCKARDCIWSEPTMTGAPNCFYDNDVTDYYLITDEQETNNSKSVVLKLGETVNKNSKWYGTQFQELKVEFVKMTKERVQIKIVPTGEDRYEVPITTYQDSPQTENSNEDFLYDVNFVTKGKFGVQVKRKSSGSIIFDSTFGQMIFADKFLQISTKLSSEYIYGFGEHQHRNFNHDINWKKFGMFSRDQFVGEDANLYGVHPFHINMEEDGNCHGILFLNSNAQEIELQPTPALTYRSVGGIFHFEIFLGPLPEQVTDQYTQLIGRPYMPPFWSLGFQLCRYGYENIENLTKVVDRMLKSDIPYDVQYSDIDYMERQLDFTVDNVTYNGLPDYVRKLKDDHHMKYIIILDPSISVNETDTYLPYEEGIQNDVFIKNIDGSDILYQKQWPDYPNITTNDSWPVGEQTNAFRAYVGFPDFAKPSTKEWWKNQCVDFHENLIEFDGLWIDMNEPVGFKNGTVDNFCPPSEYDDEIPFHPNVLGNRLYEKTLCMSSTQYNPKTDSSSELHYNMHSLYGRYQIEATKDACRASTGDRCIVISRSTFPGSGHHGGHWLGDNASDWPFMRASLIGMMEFNLFGIPYVGADICGFFNDSPRELCLRWSLIGAFYPFSRNHNDVANRDQDPANFDEEFEKAVADILKVRYTILPHFYTLFYFSSTRGSTVVRSLLAEFPKDVNTYTISEQILIGGHILLTPVLEEHATSVTGYFPDARWFDYFTGKEVEARKSSINLEAALEKLPIHIRGGAIIVTQQPEKTTSMQRDNNMGIIYACDDEGVFSNGQLYWDDGEVVDPEDNEYLLLVFRGNGTSLVSKVSAGSYKMNQTFDNVQVLGVNIDDVNSVLVNGNVHGNFTYSPEVKKLMIEDLTLDPNDSWSIEWSFKNELDSLLKVEYS